MMGFLYALAFVFESVAFIIAYILVMIGYNALRKAMARRNKRWAAEGITLAVLVLFSVIVNYLRIRKVPGSGLSAWYQAIGFFAFEGVSDGLSVCCGLRSLSFFCPLLTGAVFVSIISAKANYELFSKIRLRFKRKAKRDIYIFSAINEENLQIAESLSANEDKKNKKKKPIIIFSGPNLPVFDGKNELCRRVIKNNFYYYSYSDDVDSVDETPLAEKLGLGVLGKSVKRISDRRIVIFSFDSENRTPKEEENLAFAFTDAERVLNYLKEENKPDKKRAVLEYYVLSKRERNYQAHQGKIDELKKKFDIAEKTSPIPFCLTVWSEASRVADSVAEAVHDIVNDNQWEETLCGEEVRVWSLGYGVNAQAIVKNLYVHTARMFPDETGRCIKTNVFTVDAYSPDAVEIGGLLAYENPFCKYEPVPPSKKSVPSCVDREDVRKKFGNDKELSPLTVKLHEMSCLEYDFLKELDDVTGKESPENRPHPHIIVIATGDDYRNIKLANALIYDIEREGGGQKQLIVLNVRDKKNIALLNCGYKYDYNEKDKEPYKETIVQDKGSYSIVDPEGNGIEIVIVGMNENLYSKEIVSYEGIANYHYNYDKISEKYYQDKAVHSTLKSGVDVYYVGSGDLSEFSDKEKEIEKVIVIKADSKKTEKKDEVFSSWAKMAQWDKESNQSVSLFRETFLKHKDEIESDPKELIKWMITEHQRWNRLHFANGWVYGEKRKPKKVHDCLTSYNKVKEDTIVYDLINVLWDKNPD